MTKIAAAFPLLLILAGCGGGEPPANKAAPAGQDPYEARLEAMPEGQRNAVFIRAIRDSGQQCQRVERSTAAAPVRGRPVWTAHCEGGEDYTLAILAGGNVQVLNDREGRLIPDNAAVPKGR